MSIAPIMAKSAVTMTAATGDTHVARAAPGERAAPTAKERGLSVPGRRPSPDSFRVARPSADSQVPRYLMAIRFLTGGSALGIRTVNMPSW